MTLWQRFNRLPFPLKVVSAILIMAVTILFAIWIVRTPRYEPERIESITEACRALDNVLVDFAAYPGPDTLPLGGEDAVAVHKWKKKISSSVSGEVDFLNEGSSHPGLYNWAYGSRGNGLRYDKHFQDDFRRFYSAAARESSLSPSQAVFVPEVSMYLTNACEDVNAPLSSAK